MLTRRGWKALAKRTLTYGLKESADLTARKFSLSFAGLEFTAQTPAGKVEVRSSLVGRINVYNILAAIGAGIALDIPVGRKSKRASRTWSWSREGFSELTKASRFWWWWITRMRTTLCGI